MAPARPTCSKPSPCWRPAAACGRPSSPSSTDGPVPGSGLVGHGRGRRPSRAGRGPAPGAMPIPTAAACRSTASRPARPRPWPSMLSLIWLTPAMDRLFAEGAVRPPALSRPAGAGGRSRACPPRRPLRADAARALGAAACRPGRCRLAGRAGAACRRVRCRRRRGPARAAGGPGDSAGRADRCPSRGRRLRLVDEIAERLDSDRRPSRSSRSWQRAWPPAGAMTRSPAAPRWARTVPISRP